MTMKNLLKSISFFAMVLMACLNLSCSSDGDESELDTEAYKSILIDDWGMIDMDYTGPSDYLEDTAEWYGFVYLKFEANGTLIYYELDYDKGMKYPEERQGSYILKGNEITFTCANNVLKGKYTIEKLEKGKMILIKKLNGGATITFTYGPSFEHEYDN